MPSYQTTAIVIGRTNLGEADRIVRLITPDHGKLSAVARGVRKVKSRAGGHLELFGEVALVLATGRGSLDVITSARLSWYPHHLATNYSALGLAYSCTAALDRLAQERHAQPELYAHLKEMFHVINAGATGPLAELWFKLRLLHHVGLRPELNRCLSCGQDNPDHTYTFDPARGGLVCQNCVSTGRPMTVNTIKLWRLLSDYPYASIHRITDASDLAAASLPAGDEFYEHHVGRAFRPGIT